MQSYIQTEQRNANRKVMEEENKEGEKRRGKKKRFFFYPAYSVFVSGCLAVSLGRDRQTAQSRQRSGVPRGRGI